MAIIRVSDLAIKDRTELTINKDQIIQRLESGWGPVPFVEKWCEASVIAALLFEGGYENIWNRADLIHYRLDQGSRTIDLARIYASEWNSNSRKAYEIKVSKSDFKSEMRKPGKYLETWRYFDEFYYVAPRGIIDPHDLPKGAGLIEVYQDERKRWFGRWRKDVVVKAAVHAPLTTDNFIYSLFHHALKNHVTAGSSAWLESYSFTLPSWVNNLKFHDGRGQVVEDHETEGS